MRSWPFLARDAPSNPPTSMVMCDLNGSIDDLHTGSCRSSRSYTDGKVCQVGLGNLGKSFERARKVMTFKNLAYKNDATLVISFSPLFNMRSACACWR